MLECLERGPVAIATARDAINTQFGTLAKHLRGWWDASNIDGMGGLDLAHGD
jgi:hypothetical protein